jgi:hypothetical protein
MEEYQQIAAMISLSMGAAWASGINLYAALVMIGLMGATGNMVLPEQLQILTDPLVISAAGFMYMVEFVADKLPGVDTGWDSLHTFIRIPAGALLAAGAVGEVAPAMELAAAVVGAGIATTSHITKAGSRVLINTSPEPLSNWVTSIGEDLLVLAGLWTAINNPGWFLGLLAIFLLLAVWFIPKLWRGIKAVFQALGRLFAPQTPAGVTPTTGDIDWPDLPTPANSGSPDAITQKPP